ASAPEQTAGAPASEKAADARCGVRNPRIITDVLDIEAASIIEVFREPEKHEIPGRVAHEFRDHEALDASQANNFAKGEAFRKLTCFDDFGCVERGASTAAAIRNRPPEDPNQPERPGCEHVGAHPAVDQEQNKQ